LVIDPTDGGWSGERRDDIVGQRARRASLCFFLPTMNDVQELSVERRSPAQNSSNEIITNSTAERPALQGTWTDDTILAHRGFKIGAGSGMVTDHLTSSYQQSLNSLPRKNSFSVASS
jgi:hypothetical protein